MTEQVLCPKCGGAQYNKVTFTWWGGLVGPAVLNHVKCANCGATFNSKTGQPNTTGIAIWASVGGAIGVIIIVVAIIIAAST